MTLMGVMTFLACLVAHIVWWRARRPRSDVRALFLVFLVLPAVVAVGAMLVLPPFQVAGAFLLHVALACAYIQTYPAAQAQSPSLHILMAVGRAPQGLSREELLGAGSGEALVGARVDDLVANRLIVPEGDRYVLAPAARRLVLFFLGFRRVLGLTSKGG